jgi:C-terminal processing protease CtpA/Prc
VRYRPLDTSFSYITSRADNAAFFDDSQYVGLGFVDKLFGRDYRAIEVYAGSPAAEAGIERGARFLEIGGRSVESWLQTGELGNAFGPRQAGVTVQVRFQDTQGSVRSATLTKRAVTIPTVSATRVFDVDGRRVGYVYFRNFVRPSTQALSDAFATLRAAG